MVVCEDPCTCISNGSKSKDAAFLMDMLHMSYLNFRACLFLLLYNRCGEIKVICVSLLYIAMLQDFENILLSDYMATAEYMMLFKTGFSEDLND